MAALSARSACRTADCCEDARGLPQAEADVEAPTDAGALPVAAVFQQQCTPCHQTPEPTPPNFLHGDANRVNAALAACAPRIFVRVSMWQVKPGARDKTPMPPAFALHAAGAGRGEQAPDPAVIASLRGLLARCCARRPDAHALRRRAACPRLRESSALPAGGFMTQELQIGRASQREEWGDHGEGETRVRRIRFCARFSEPAQSMGTGRGPDARAPLSSAVLMP